MSHHKENANNMASQEEQFLQNDHSTTPYLPLFSRHVLLEHQGMATPLYTTSSSIPFTWEEKPGKRRPPSTPSPLTRLPHASKILEPPPGRGLICYLQNKTKTTSPDTVLDGPYGLLNSSSSEFVSSSFKSFLNEDGIYSGNKKVKRKKLFFPSWKLRSSIDGKREIVTTSNRSFISEKSVNISRISRNGRLHSLSHKPQFWASLYQGFKYILPWKTSRSSRKI